MLEEIRARCADRITTGLPPDLPQPEEEEEDEGATTGGGVAAGAHGGGGGAGRAAGAGYGFAKAEFEVAHALEMAEQTTILESIQHVWRPTGISSS